MPITSDLFDDSPRLQKLPISGADIQWMPALLDPSESMHLFEMLHRSVPWRQEDVFLFGRRIAQPRLTAWYGDADARYRYSGLELSPLPWTEVLLQLRQRVEDVSQARYNSVLLNLYRDGQDSMGWHSDDEPELGMAPTIASLSLGETRLFRLKPKQHGAGKTISLPLTSGSLLVMRGATQAHYLHAVPKERRVTTPRINLTFRMIVN
ncbi:MAG TPA: alpha-ketoglutarate-dependent dioxygenase AlkB [Oxalicibacterium sp.]|jgi:alkylated DNA repair dioxygenase AlkB|nr:alpha-ketoglutarate-dependent dioxygenase AlkB [Oxalicibacterium sp.]